MPDVSGLIPSHLGDALRPDRRQADGCLPGPADRGGRVGRVRAGRPRLPDLDRLLLRHARPRCPALALAGIPPAPTSCSRRRPRTALVISDLPGPTGGIMLKSTTGATIIVNDTGIYIQNGKGASIVHDRPDRHHQQRRAGGGLRREVPGFLVHVGATVLCAHGGQAQPTVPNPRVMVSGKPTVDDGRAVRRRRLPVRSPAARRRPCVTAQWMMGGDAGHVERPAARAARQPGRLRADRHAGSRSSPPQTAGDGTM